MSTLRQPFGSILTSAAAPPASSTGRTVSTAARRLASLPRHREQVVRSRYRKSTSMVCLAPLTSSSGIFVVISVPPFDDALAPRIVNNSPIKTEQPQNGCREGRFLKGDNRGVFTFF